MTVATRSQAESIIDVLLYTSALPRASTDFLKSQKAQLREHAVRIWNSCNLISASNNAQFNVGVAKLRAFAYLLLASIAPQSSRKSGSIPKLFENCLTATRECLKAGHIELAGQLLGREADTPLLVNEEDPTREDTQEHISFVVGYYCLRLLHDWKRKRADLADRHYSRLLNMPHRLTESDAEKIVDLMFEIGRECLTQHDADNAAKWLERAMQTMNQENVHDAFAGSDIRLSVLHCLGEACAAQGADILDQLRSEYGAKLPILLLTLEVACKQPAINADTVSSQIEGIMHTAHLIEANHGVMMHYIQRLSSASTPHATRCLKKYIIQRLIPEGNIDWTENGIKTIRETDNGGSRSLAMLWCQTGLHRIFEMAGEASIGKLERQLVSYHLLVSNTGLAHQILDQMSFIPRNNKHSRYLAYCAAVRSGNEGEAQSCLNTITNGQGDMDQLLFACIGESIRYGKSSDTACLLQRVIDKHVQSLSSDINLVAVLKYTTKTLLEAIAGLDASEEQKEELLTRLCAIFKHTVKLQDKFANSSKSRRPAAHFDTVWFEQKSFEIARSHANLWPPKYIIDLLQYSIQLCLPEGGGPLEIALSRERRTHLRDVTFMQAILYAIEAQSISPSRSVEDLPQTSYDSRIKPKSSECRLVLHRQVFRIFTTLREQYQSQPAQEKEEREVTQGQLQTLAPLAFEALLFMSAHAYLTDETAFDEISVKQFLGTVNELEAPAATYALLADTVLVFASSDSGACPRLNGLQIPSISAARLLGQVVQILRQLQEYSIEQAARWIRCVIQLIIEDIEKVLPNTKLEQSLTILQSVIEQAMDLAKSCPLADAGGDVPMNSDPNQSYPPEELEWIATKLFNMAVDLYSAGEPELAQQWASQAVAVANLLLDASSGLGQVLHDKTKELFGDIQFDG
ncbi:hypothetical protein LTR70_003954 [Exophiala xenobiotica]|nr:hypothetical protein LTR70_003954 [Exophiala xenobiotica]